MADEKNVMVTLKTKARKDYKSKDQKFTVAHANAVLKLPNSQWELNDAGWKWNGTELAVNSKK